MTIAVFFGSKSPEHEVSIITAQLILSELARTNHKIVAVYITKEGKWLVQEADKIDQNSQISNSSDNPQNSQNNKSKRTGLLALSTFDLENENWMDKSWQEWQINSTKSVGKLVLTKKNWIGSDKIEIDLVFPALHGNCGEDGAIQGLCQMFGVPIVGCDLASSAISMNKILSKIVAQNSGVPTAKYLSQSSLEIQNWQQNPNLKDEFINQIEQEIGYPNFVKPPKLGSSIGISKVQNRSELLDAIDLCLYYDDQILVETSVENLADLTCCVLQNSTGIKIKNLEKNENKSEDILEHNLENKLENDLENENKEKGEKGEKKFPTLLTSLVQESIYSKELFSFEDKYLENGGSQTGQNTQKLIIPAQIDDNITKQIQEYSQILFAKIGGSGIARFDFLLNKETGKLYFSEINPLPGNLYRHLWKKTGVKFDQVIEILIQTAIENSKNPKITNFSSNLLKIANSSKMGGKFGKGVGSKFI